MENFQSVEVGEELTVSWGRYCEGRRLSRDDSLHSPTAIPPSALDKLSIMKSCNRRRTLSHTSPRHSLTMVTLHDTRFVQCRWWNDGVLQACFFVARRGPRASRVGPQPGSTACGPLKWTVLQTAGGGQRFTVTRTYSAVCLLVA